MARVKGGVTTRKRHRRHLRLTKGYRHGRRKLFSLAKQAWLKAGQHAHRHRKTKKRVFRRLWITKINAAARTSGLSYREFIHGLHKADIQLDRKVLAEIAESNPETFSELIAKARAALQEEP